MLIKTFIRDIIRNNNLKNFLYLGLSQGINLIMPILIIPYLIKTVGIEKFGVIALMQTISTFFFIFTDYGFNITAVRELSLCDFDPQKIEKIVNKVLVSKFFLTLLSLPFFILVSYLFLKTNNSPVLIFGSFFLVIGRAFFPTWLFQGLEKNQYLAYCNLLSKLFFLIFLFCFVRTEADFVWSNFLLGLSNVVFGVGISIFYLRKLKVKILNQKLSFSVFLKNLSEGKNVFFSNFAANTYANSNILILSLFSTSYYVGLYSIAEKVVSLSKVPLEIFLQAVYPYTCKLVKSKGYAGLNSYLTIVKPILIIGISLLCLFLAIFSKQVSFFFLNKDDPYLVKLVRITQIIPIIVSLNVSYYLILLSYNFVTTYSRILIYSSIFSIVISFILVPKYQIVGTLISVVLTEIIVISSLKRSVVKLKIKNKFNEVNL